MDRLLPPPLVELRQKFQALTETSIAPHAAEVDREATWPAHAFAALKAAGVMGLHVPRAAGGLEQGLLALAVATEAIGRACPSSAICYGMHCVATAVIAAKASPYHVERYLKPIAAGEHITTLSLSERGSGAQFYLPETQLTREADAFVLNGRKQFVTNAGHADSYVVSTLSSQADAQPGDFNCLIVDRDQSGMSFLEPWDGFGMRGNSARAMELQNVRVPLAHLLGNEGDQTWYVFEVVAPFFLVAMSGTYLGLAQAALDETIAHLKLRSHTASGEALAANDAIQMQVAELWTRVERTRQWLFHAAHQGDLGAQEALPLLLGSKVEAAETAVSVTNEAMTLCGGIAYGENSRLARLLRDARAAPVMTPTTAILRQWIGRVLLGRPLL